MTTRKLYLDVRHAPSAREIKRICRQIRAGWSPAERISRIVDGLQMRLTRFSRLLNGQSRPISRAECR